MTRIFQLGFIVAGLVNIVGILVISQGMTSTTLGAADPVFAKFGIIMIILWGLAYIGTAPYAQQAVFLPLVFAVEKAVYTVNWVVWMDDHGEKIDAIREADPLAGFFLNGYGINDGLFGVFFLIVALVNWRKRA